ncbi:hypothetical protein PGT21_017805 [Puccinia graminis f. sp. tritici]|uniref:Uncharacterized protein n=1 Tax=Puccinia graminis f. sp. tritici TaxID=56615 RepID=A0A5B0M2W2_PUCGR|nr:hypothetical protein PGT21_017805 [Puccinia graminis f. sp. tritici]KAA1089795.1 hypothetical protein PGTUg99_013028 [Puccinia graminis f. sp. tritici]
MNQVPEPKPFYHQHHSSKKKNKNQNQQELSQARLPNHLTRKTTITSRTRAKRKSTSTTKQQTLSFKQQHPLGINIQTQCSPLTYQRIHPKEKIQQLNRAHGGWIEDHSSSDHANPVENNLSSPTYCNTSPTPEASTSFMDEYPMEELSETEDEDTTGQSRAPSRHERKPEKVILCPESLDRQKYPSRSQEDSHPDIRAGHKRLQKAVASQDGPVAQAQESFSSESQTGVRSHSCALFFFQDHHQPNSPVEQSQEDHEKRGQNQVGSPTTHMILCPESLDNQLLAPESLPLINNQEEESYLAPSQSDDDGRTHSCALFYDHLYPPDEADHEPLTTRENPPEILCPSSLQSQLPCSHNIPHQAPPPMDRQLSPHPETLPTVFPESLLLETQDRSFSCALFFHEDEIEETCLDHNQNSETRGSQDTKEAGKKRIVLAEESQELLPGPSTLGRVQNNHSSITSRDSEERGKEKIVLAEESQEMSPGMSVSGHRSLAPPTPISARRVTRPSFSTFSASGFVPSPSSSSSSSLTRNLKRKSPNPPSSTSVATDGSQKKKKKGKKSIDPFASHVRPAWTANEKDKVPKLHPPTLRQIGLAQFLVPVTPSVNNNNNNNKNNNNNSNGGGIKENSQKDRAPLSRPLPLEFSRFIDVARTSNRHQCGSEKSQIGKGKEKATVEVEEDEIIVSDDEINFDHKNADKSNNKEKEEEDSSRSSSPSVHMIPDSQPTSVLVPSSPPLPSAALDSDHTINREDIDEEDERGRAQVVMGFRERIRLAREREDLCRWALDGQADRPSQLHHPLHHGLHLGSASDRSSGDLRPRNQLDPKGNPNQEPARHKSPDQEAQPDHPKHRLESGPTGPSSVLDPDQMCGRLDVPDQGRLVPTGTGNSLSVSAPSSFDSEDLPSVTRRPRHLTPSSSSSSAPATSLLMIGPDKPAVSAQAPAGHPTVPDNQHRFVDVDRLLDLLVKPLPPSSSSLTGPSTPLLLPHHPLVGPSGADNQVRPPPPSSSSSSVEVLKLDPSELDLDRFVARYTHLLRHSLLTPSSSTTGTPADAGMQTVARVFAILQAADPALNPLFHTHSLQILSDKLLGLL